MWAVMHLQITLQTQIIALGFKFLNRAGLDKDKTSVAKHRISEVISRTAE